MSVKYLLLGFLMERPCHGYELKSAGMKKIRGDFGINDGQLYPMLRTMEKEGLVEKAVEHQEGAPSRHVYSITEKGRAQFMAWLASDEGEERSFRYDFFRKDPFLMRCTYIRYLDREEALAKVCRQMEVVKAAIEDLKAARASMEKKGVAPHRISIVDYSIMSQETRLKWLARFLEQLEQEKPGTGV